MSDDVRAIVEAAGACFDRRDLDGLDDLVADDMVNHAAGPQGRDGWKLVWGSILTCFPDAETETHAIYVDGEWATVHVSIHGTHEASVLPLLEGVPVTHRKATWEFIHLFRVADGRIIEHRAVRDDLGLLRQLGA